MFGNVLKMMLMGHRSTISGIEILEINETDAAKKSALTTQCFSNKISRATATATATATTPSNLDASTLSAILLNPSRMLPSSSLLSITNEQTKGNINFNCSYCTNDYSSNNNNNNTMYSNSSRNNDKSKVCHLHMQQNEDENEAYEQNAANFLCLKRQKGQKNHERGEEVEDGVKDENNKNNNRNHHSCSSSSSCINDSHSSSRNLYAKTKHLQLQLHWWWCTCFVVAICLSLPSTTNMQPQDFVSLPKSSKLSPSLSSKLSTSLSQTNSLLFTPTLTTTATTIVTLQNITSGTSSATLMQSTAYTTVTKDYLLERQRNQQRQQQSVRQKRQHLKLMTTLRSLHARKRRRRSMLTSHYDESNGTTSRNANLSVNLDDNNNSTHYFTNNNNNNHNIECPSYNENSACPCYKFEDGLFLECPGTTAMSLRSTLERISSPIHSLSIYDFDRSVTSLSQDVFQAGVNIRHLQFSHSHLETLKDNSLKHVRASLESLSIVNGKLMQIPTRALNSMQKLSALDFDYNEITKMDNYGFYGLRLSKLNIKGNRLQSLPEHAFNGLEEYMQEIDLSENSLRTFPLLSLRKLDYLRILRLSNNKISTFYGDITLATNNASAVVGLRLPSLIFLDLSSNEFTEIVDESFHTFPQLKTLSLYANQIELVQAGSFKSLRELMSLDMSHNRIISLDPKLFDKNIRLQTVDLSHNHIHSISGVFSNLPQLREIFLSENNILELPADAFANSSNVDVIYLESNAISHVDPNVFSSLVNLDHLYLRSNFIPLVPVTLFDRCQKLTSLSLDNNEIQDLEIGMFRKLELLREIRLHNNRIRRIRKGVFEPLPALQELHVQQNNIEDIEPGAFERLTNLQHINLQDNQLTVLEDIFPRELVNSSLLSVQFDTNYLHKIHQLAFRQQYRVQIMWLRDNGLTRLEKTMFVDLKHLGRLYLSNNQIRDIDRDTFTPLKNLTLLDLSENRLKQLRREYFSTLQSLEELNLSTNYIEAIESNTFSKLKKLRILDLSNNPLTTIAKDVFDEELPLTQLNLRNTSLRKIDIYTFKPLPNLNELNLELNYFSPSNVQLLDVPSLRGLYLSHNDFSDAHGNGALESNMFEKLRSLQHLSMANCSIATIPAELFLRNTNLVKLDLCDNLLTSINRNIFSGLNVFKELRLCRNNLIEFPHIALYNLSTLEYLDLSRNQLTSVDFFKLSGTLNLRQLNLRENKISTLTGFNAVNLTQLDNVDLSGNLLLSLPANFLRHSINLQRVDLSSNRFLQIPSTALSDISIPRLSWLNLTANPINKIYTVKEERYPYLKELYICHTNLSILTSKDFESFQALQHLHLVKNRIMRISPGAFKSLSNLLTLDISINELELLPKERLQGLRILRLLNISHNSLKELEEFSSDLSNLQICDLSFNQLDRISKKTFRNLHSLTELHLMGNRMTVLSTEAFRFLRKLQVLDLRKNYFELITVDALKPLETNLKTLKIEENPLHCSCDAQKLWEWLRDHRKWALASDKINYLKCEQPAELRGKIFARMEPQQFCDAPLIPKIAIQDIQPYSVVVSWQSREHLGLNGYEIVYYITTDGIDIDELKGKRLNGSANSAKLTKLSSNTRYHICVIGTGNWLSEPVVHALQKIHFNETAIMQRDDAYAATTGAWHKQPHHMDDVSDMDLSSLEPQQQQALIENTIVTDTHILRDVLKNSHISACTDVQTLDSTPSLIADENSLARNGFLHSILTRRLGLIVGCCLGIIVFIVMISVLSYVKLKKQRLESAKRQATLPQEYISYRHFSIPNDELRAAAALPGGISAHISGTSLSTSITTATATTPLSNALPLKSINEDSVGTGSEANLSLDGGDVSVGKQQQQQQHQQTNVKGTSLEGSVLTTAANSHNHHQVPNLQHMLHHHHHAHLQQQTNNHIGGNGNVLGYMAAGVVLGANHLNSH